MEAKTTKETLHKIFFAMTGKEGLTQITSYGNLIQRILCAKINEPEFGAVGSNPKDNPTNASVRLEMFACLFLLYIFRCASAKAERGLSSLSCVWMYADQNQGTPPGNGISTGNSLISSPDLDSSQKFILD